MKTLTPASAVACALLVAAAPTQQLRRAVVAADAIVVAESEDAREHGDLAVHRLRVIRTLEGTHLSAVAVLQPKGVALHEAPSPGSLRLYCLRDAGEVAARAGLPAGDGPYFRLVGAPGSTPAVADAEEDPAVALVETLLQAQGGAPAREVVPRLLESISDAPSPVRIEAARTLAEWPRLHRALHPLETSGLVALAVSETDDVSFKIALAELCAELRVEGLVDALCVSLPDVEDRRFAEALGRIARHLHDGDAARVLRGHLLRARGEDTRHRLLLALGATSTEGALEVLLDWRETHGPSRWVDAALRLHGAPRAIEAVERRQR